VSRGAPRLYIITDRRAAGARGLPAVVRAAVAAAGTPGLPPEALAVQLREKDLDGRALSALAHELRAITADAGVALWINDRVDVALAVGADGVHLGGGALGPADVARVAPALAVAVSTHAPADVAAAAAAPNVRFAVFGPIFDTPSKRAYGPPQGLEALRAAVAAGSVSRLPGARPLPILALGGVTPARAAACLAAGASGLAFVGAVMAAADPTRAVCEFSAAFLGS
jgi:thiamine-phosphate pyrophosphorylase